jgi:hypothetical protein
MDHARAEGHIRAEPSATGRPHGVFEEAAQDEAAERLPAFVA